MQRCAATDRPDAEASDRARGWGTVHDRSSPKVRQGRAMWHSRESGSSGLPPTPAVSRRG
jgi:hypothetical protein